MLSLPFLSHCHSWLDGQTLGDNLKGCYELVFCLRGDTHFFTLLILPDVYFCRIIPTIHPHMLKLSIPMPGPVLGLSPISFPFFNTYGMRLKRVIGLIVGSEESLGNIAINIVNKNNI